MYANVPKAELRTQLRRACTYFISGHIPQQPGEEFIRIGEWCREHQYDADVYGSGKLISDFEAKVASLLGKPAAVFMPSGTMAQQIALRIFSDRSRLPVVAMHPTCHLELHEQKGYTFLHGLASWHVGDRTKPVSASDIGHLAQPVAALVLELPAREIGGQLPTWDELGVIKKICGERGIKLCLDGTRLWESKAFYEGKSYAEICAGFDSVYVSFYKGIGGLAGAMLLGDDNFIAEARLWQRRHGGNLVQLHPFVASSAMRFDERIARMPAYFARAQQFAKAMAAVGGVTVNPKIIQANMLHLHFPVSIVALEAARDQIADEHKCWLGNPRAASDVPGCSAMEIYVGENLMSLSDDFTSAMFKELLTLARVIDAKHE